ncbi:MAG TPA: hypothetical protein VFU71_11370 [Burkholderiaceae bacterium]|nr:hypothetical protein [Burkholderiaceae bacterium]
MPFTVTRHGELRPGSGQRGAGIEQLAFDPTASLPLAGQRTSQRIQRTEGRQHLRVDLSGPPVGRRWIARAAYAGDNHAHLCLHGAQQHVAGVHRPWQGADSWPDARHAVSV